MRSFFKQTNDYSANDFDRRLITEVEARLATGYRPKWLIIRQLCVLLALVVRSSSETMAPRLVIAAVVTAVNYILEYPIIPPPSSRKLGRSVLNRSESRREKEIGRRRENFNIHPTPSPPRGNLLLRCTINPNEEQTFNFAHYAFLIFLRSSHFLER